MCLCVHGRAGQAAFFHYLDANGHMDSGWTKHSGCPVLEGTKWIATQWIRHVSCAFFPLLTVKKKQLLTPQRVADVLAGGVEGGPVVPLHSYRRPRPHEHGTHR
jgi:hypothetical protein